MALLLTFHARTDTSSLSSEHGLHAELAAPCKQSKWLMSHVALLELQILCRPVNGAYLPGQPPACAPAHLQPMYPHQMAMASYPLHAPQPQLHAQTQALPGGWQPRAPVTGLSSAPAQLTDATGRCLHPSLVLYGCFAVSDKSVGHASEPSLMLRLAERALPRLLHYNESGSERGCLLGPETAHLAPLMRSAILACLAFVDVAGRTPQAWGNPNLQSCSVVADNLLTWEPCASAGDFPQAQRQGSVPVPSFPAPITLLAPRYGPQQPAMAAMQGFALPPRYFPAASIFFLSCVCA